MWHRVLKYAWVVLAVIVATDLILAQAGKRVIPEWRDRILEERARIAQPPFNHGMAPLAEFGHGWGDARAPYFTNSLGFRDAAPRHVPLRSGTPRILLIGDSFTEGIGVPFEETFAGRIGEAMKAAGIDVLNAALTSYAPTVYYRKIKHYVATLGLAADAVVVFMDLSDMDDEVKSYRMDDNEIVKTIDIRRYAPLKRLKLFLKDHSVLYHTYRLWKDAFVEQRRRDREGPVGAVTNKTKVRWTVDDALFESTGRPGLQKAKALMDRLHAFLTERGLSLTVAVYPWPDQIVERDLDSRQVRFWKHWTKERGAGFIDLFPYFIDGRDPAAVIRQYFIPYDVHFNSAGHALVAKAFLENYRGGPEP